MPAGYKQTDVGAIPEDWEVKSIGDVSSFANGKPYEPFINPNGTVCLITLDSISIDGKLKDHHKKVGFYDDSLKTDDLVVVLSDIAHAKLLGLGDLIPASDRFVLNQRMGRVRFTNDVFPEYGRLQINFRQDFFRARGQGTSQKHIYKRDVFSLQIPLPEKKEQKAIAQALSDIDTLITKLSQLIQKKRYIKQGAMQELLTGKRRLPGFSGEWKEKKLKEVAEMNSGGTPSTKVASYYNGNILWASISDMTGTKKHIFDTEKKLTKLGLKISSAKIFPKGTVLFAMYASIGECCIAKTSIATSQAILGIQCSKDLLNEYLYYYLRHIKESVKALGQQGTQSNLNKGIVQNFILNMPSIMEQTAIAQVLSDMDAEIEALEKQKAKYIDLKQGMMQQLLTGKIRLV